MTSLPLLIPGLHLLGSGVKNPISCHHHSNSHPEVGSLHQPQSFTAALSPKQVLFPGNQDNSRSFLGQGCPPCPGARCAPQLAAPAAGGSSPRAGLMDGFSQQEIAGSSSADPSASPCSPFFPFPAELGIQGSERLGNGDSARKGGAVPRKLGHPGGIHTPQCFQTCQESPSHPRIYSQILDVKFFRATLP